jgi:tripartite-type tricarboxylate transporter receptor subunit TctC
LKDIMRGSVVRRALWVLGWGLMAWTCPWALAQNQPATETKPLKFVVPFPPGSGTDTSARYYARKVTELTGQAVWIENKPGANGFIAVRQVLSAPADGSMVFVGSNSTLAVNAALFKQLPYDPVADFSPLSMLMRSPALMVVPPQLPQTQLMDWIQAARARPQDFSYGSGSAGYQLMAELFNEAANTSVTGVPFKGASEAVTAVASGTVQLAFAEMTSAQELVKSGRIRALAVASNKRSAVLPSVPTASEAGLPGFSAYSWVAAAVSARTPKEETDRLAALFTRIANLPETKEFYERIGAEVMRGGPAEMRAFQQDEIRLWKRIAAQAKVELQ